MADTVIKNVNKVVQTKNELKSILQALGETPTEKFDTYADLFTYQLALLESKSDYIIGNE